MPTEGMRTARPSAPFADYEIEVVLRITTTAEDVEDCLIRSGITEGSVIGEALIESVVCDTNWEVK